MLREMDDSDGFISMVSSISCIVTKAQLRTDTEINALVDLVDRLATKQKYLVVSIPNLTNFTRLQNKSLNYNVVIYHDGNKTK